MLVGLLANMPAMGLWLVCRLGVDLDKVTQSSMSLRGFCAVAYLGDVSSSLCIAATALLLERCLACHNRPYQRELATPPGRTNAWLAQEDDGTYLESCERLHGL